MQRLILIAILALSTIIIGCAPANVTITTPGNADENSVNMRAPAQVEDNSNWSWFYNG